MERGRVVHYAKTKTSKVITPSTIQRQKSSPGDGASGHAPLALGEADFPFTPARRVSDASQQRPRVRSLSKERQTATLPFSRAHGDIRVKEMVYRDRRDGFQFSGAQICATLDDMRLRKAPSAKKIYPGPVLVSPTSPPRNTQQPNFVLTSRSSSRIAPGTVPGNCAPNTDDVHMTSSVTRTNGGYIRNTVLSNIASSLDVKRDREIPFRDFNISSKADLTVYKSFKPSSAPHSPKDEVDNVRPNSRPTTNALRALKKEPVVKHDTVAETAGGDDSHNDHTTEPNDGVVIHWTVNEQNAIICRKLSVRSTRSENEEDNVKLNSADAVEMRKANNVTSSPSPPARFTGCMVPQDERYNSDKDSGVQSDNTSQNSETHASELDDKLDMDSSPTSTLSKWKRNSLRMATQGFTSMSDLTNSAECLQIISHDARHFKRNPIESVSPTNHKDPAPHRNPLTPSPGDVLFSSNGQIYTFFEQMNSAKPKSSNSTKADVNRTGTPISQNVSATDRRTPAAGSPTSCEVASEDTETSDRNEKVVLAKRHSYIMATTSNSDLSCVNIEPVTNGTSQKSNPSVERLRNKSFIGRVILPSSSPKLMREDSLCSSPHDSSFGSFYSCQSAEFVSAKSSPYLNRDEQSAKTFRDNSFGRASDRPRARPPCSDDESESVYCTASDTSFLETHTSSPRLTKDTKSPSPSHKMQTPPSQVTARNTRIPIPLHNKGLSPKSLKKLNTVLQCYGCSTVDKSNSVMMMNRQRGKTQDLERNRAPPSVQRTVTMNRFQDPKFKTNARLPDSRFRCKSTPTVRLMNFDLRDEFDHFQHDDSDSEYDWSDMPRSPPALGRPKRKVYAGFDSQPLPMDSFMSDSSSCYTDCGGSWSSRATSKSAEVERSYHGSMDNLASVVRSASAEAVDTITPTRHMSQNTLLDFFRLGDKQSAVCENNHNVYVSSPEDGGNEDKLRGSYEAKTFSNESLHSNLSTATTTSLQQRSYPSYTDSVDFNKLSPGEWSLDGLPKRNNFGLGYNNVRRNNELTVGDSERLSLDFKFRNSQEFLNNSWRSDTKEVKVQRRPLKAASSASSAPWSRPRYHPKRKYFSSKDILDLLVTPDRRVHGPWASSALEKQAQKVCRAILCCNDMEASMHSAQYQF